VVCAGIWEAWQSPEGETPRTFATITTDANHKLAATPDRMPVVVEPENWPLWLCEVQGDPATLLRPAAENVLRFWPVDKKVGSVRDDGPELMERVPVEPPLL
jgi:putative SOS response-associated peptidase YedK